MSRDAKHPQLQLLDCTLRDGGYYNQWDFSKGLVAKYLTAMAHARVPVVELGFRFLEPKGFAGPTAYTTDEFINDFDIPESIQLAVMTNAKDLVNFHAGPSKAVDKLFSSSDRSRVDLVRIATTWQELMLLRPSVDRLHELGYQVGVNLMQVHARSVEELEEFGDWCDSTSTSIAYFADSFGGLYPSDIEPIVKAIGRGFRGPIGCHFHDNLSLAMANSIAAIQAGVTWVDSTIRGMGRGPGNARTEYLAVELRKRELLDLDVGPLLELVTCDFSSLQDQFGWGTNLFYVLSAIHGVHPTYVQNLMADPRYDAADIAAIVERLGLSGGASYRMDMVSEANAAAMAASSGTWDASGWCEGRKVLILGPGPSAIDRRSDVERFIVRSRPLVLNLNLRPLVDPSLIDAYVACNPMRATLDRYSLPSDDTPIIAPSFIGDLVCEREPERPFLDYGLSVSSDSLEVNPTGCAVPQGLVAAYALAVAVRGGAKELSLVGLDGFDSSDPRQAGMVAVFEQFLDQFPNRPLVSLTPTSYPIQVSSLYAPVGS